MGVKLGTNLNASAGLLVFRKRDIKLEVFLTHPGGPIWTKRDVWSIPKGVLEAGEDNQQAAFREFQEEVGIAPPAGTLLDLGSLKTKSGKTNHIMAVEGDFNVESFVCASTFTMEWPPKSGNIQKFPENDRAAWFEVAIAMTKVFPDQTEFLSRLLAELDIKAVELPSPPQQQSLL